MTRWLTAGLGLMALAIGGACSEGGTTGPALIPCTSTGDCSSTQICAVLPSGSQACTGAECGCLDCEPCPTGKQCQQGQCIDPGATCTGDYCPGDPCATNDQCDAATQKCAEGACWPLDACFAATASTDCPNEGDACVEHQCVPCVGDQCGAPGDCTVDGCDPGTKCDATTKLCVVDTGTGAAEACQACTGAADCGTAGFGCVPLGGAQVCLAPCGTGDDCPTGWTCWGAGGNNYCAPGGFQCSGCAVDGCPDGQICNTNDGVCTVAQTTCAQCQYDWECGPDAACHSVGGTRSCVPRCTGGVACAADATCVSDSDTGVKVCEPNSGVCGAGACQPACGGATPYCKGTLCVGCLNDGQCAQGETCNPTTNACETGGTSCQAPTPYFSADDGKCVQCLENTHCNSGTCNLTTKICEGDECAVCVDPYPACALVGGDYYCVQCTGDAECGVGGTCNLNTYSCEGGTVTPTDACETDADCDAGVSGFTLTCHPDGYCIDVTGQCDDITAFCIGGNKCVSLIEQFIGGGLELPPELLGGGAGGATLAGACECVPEIDVPLIGGASNDCPDKVNCSKGLMGSLMELLGGGGTNPLGSVYTCNGSTLF
jgi:Cys-rich repeat protein